MIVESQVKRSRRWPGIVAGLIPSVLALAVAVISIPPRVLDVYDDFGQRLDTGNRDFAEQRITEMFVPALFGYGILLAVAFVLIDLDVRAQLGKNILIGLGVGLLLMLVGGYAQSFLDTYV